MNNINLMFLYLQPFQQKLFCTNFYKLLETEINKYWSQINSLSSDSLVAVFMIHFCSTFDLLYDDVKEKFV